MFDKFVVKIKKNKVEFILLLSILLLASFLRLYNLNDYLHFAHDEARDALAVKNILEKGEVPLLGPEASIGHFHLGPFFYYFLFPFSLLFNNAPVSGAFMVAILGIATVFLIWKMARQFFSKEAGIIISFLYSISFVIIMHSRWSWNLNPLPFFVLFYIYSFFKITKQKKLNNKWFYLWVASIAIMIQLHASAFLFLPVSVVLLLIFKFKKLSWKSILIGLTIFIVLNSPFMIYELTNNLENCHKVYNMIFEQVGNQNVFKTIWLNGNNFSNLINALVFANFSGLDFNLLFKIFKNEDLSWISILPGFITLLTLVIFSIYYFVKYKNKEGFRIVFILSALLLPGFLVFQQALYLHYYVIFFPLIFLFLGHFLSFIFKQNILGKIFCLGFIILVLFLNISHLLNYWSSLSRGSWKQSYSIPLYQMKNAVNYIAEDAKSDKINLKCEIEGYCLAFEYLFSQKNIKIDNTASKSFRIYKSYISDSLFKPIAVENIN